MKLLDPKLSRMSFLSVVHVCFSQRCALTDKHVPKTKNVISEHDNE